MDKQIGKGSEERIRLPSIIIFIETFITDENSQNLIKTIEGRNGGTWMNEDVAPEFFRWFSWINLKGPSGAKGPTDFGIENNRLFRCLDQSD
jgi:hypothetical protein